MAHKRADSSSPCKTASLLEAKSYMSITDDNLSGFDAFTYETRLLFIDAFKVHFDTEKAIER